jgi:multicomponent Na+:H+ antiporter subunit A
MLLLIVLGAAALAAPPLVSRLGPRAFWVLALAPAAAAVWLAARASGVAGGTVHEEVHPWVSTLHLELAFRLDPLSLVLALVATAIGALVLVYCRSYFDAGEQGLGRFAAVLTGFAGAMLGLVLADDLLLLYVFWELTTVLSFLLIGHASDKDGARRAALDALIVTTVGGLAMLVGAVMVGEAAGTYRISEIVARPPGGVEVEIGVALLLVGAVSKSALVPFHFWLPAAMAAPTPVSAYLHAAAMVKAGVYLVARLAPAFHHLLSWQILVLGLGLTTMIVGGVRALRQHDLKLLLAFGTVSQLGLLIAVLGTGTQAAAIAGMAMLVAHALYKASLFLVVGIVDKLTGTRDVRVLSGLGRRHPWLAATGVLAAASMAGVPLLAGFAAKESIFYAYVEGDVWDSLILAVLVAGAILTAGYAARFAWGAFATKPGVPDRRCAALGRPFAAAPAVLAAAGLVLGLGISRLDELLGRYAHDFPEAASGAQHLAAWHGVGLPLVLTAIALVAGGLLPAVSARAPIWTAGRARAQRLRELLHGHPRDARACYQGLVRATETAAIAAARGTQSGSLPVYLMTILVVVIAAQVAVLATGAPWTIDARAWDSPAQLVVGVLIVAGAILTLRARRRMKAVMLSGVVGYGVATLFALQGAPDLALTQFLVETVTLVVIVLVLRRLPTHFTGTVTRRGRRSAHLLIGIAFGVLMALLTLLALGARVDAPASELMAAASELAGGKNIVNVTLVDLRAWDTMGELAVVVVAATGVTSLTFLRRRSRALPRLDDADDDVAVWSVPGAGPAPASPLRVSVHQAGGEGTARRARAWLLAEGTLAPERRSVVLEVIVRLIFHTVMVLSIYLLWAGHDYPGGGFAAGIVAGLALTVRYLAGGRYELGETAPVSAGVLIGAGLVIATGTAIGGGVLGDAVLQSGKVTLDLPGVAPLKLYSSTLFDVGVWLVVVGVVLDVLRSFGSEIDRQIDEEQHRPVPTVAPRPVEGEEAT